MLTNKRLLLPKASGDWAKDGPELYRTLQQYFLSLEQPGALAIAQSNPWTPALSFVTPGNLSVVYSTQAGYYTLIETAVIAEFNIITSTFTHTTASGALRITGLPFASVSDATYVAVGGMYIGGVTKATHTQFLPYIAAGWSFIEVAASGSGVAPADVTAADCPTAGTMKLTGTIVYRT